MIRTQVGFACNYNYTQDFLKIKELKRIVYRYKQNFYKEKESPGHTTLASIWRQGPHLDQAIP